MISIFFLLFLFSRFYISYSGSLLPLWSSVLAVTLQILHESLPVPGGLYIIIVLSPQRRSVIFWIHKVHSEPSNTYFAHSGYHYDYLIPTILRLNLSDFHTFVLSTPNHTNFARSCHHSLQHFAVALHHLVSQFFVFSSHHFICHHQIQQKLDG